MRRLAAQYPRYGYRRIRIFLKREGHVMSTDRTHRLWRQAALQVPRRRPRRRRATGQPPRLEHEFLDGVYERPATVTRRHLQRQ
jgi:transposase InsO family protein